MIIDIIFLLLLSWGIYRGASKGLIVAIASFLGYFFGIIAALKFSNIAAVLIQENIAIDSKFIPFLAFLVVFVLAILIVRFIGLALTKIVNLIQLKWLNKVGGAFLYCLIYTFIFSSVLWMFHQVNLLSPDIKAKSVTFSYLEPLAPQVIRYSSEWYPFLEGTFETLEKLFEELATKNSPLDV